MMVVSIKRGDTLKFEIILEDIDGNALEGAADGESEVGSIKIRSQIRDQHLKFIAEFDIEDKGDGVYVFSTPSTSSFPIGDLLFDIEVDRDGIVTSSDTMVLRIMRDVTFDE